MPGRPVACLRSSILRRSSLTGPATLAVPMRWKPAGTRRAHDPTKHRPSRTTMLTSAPRARRLRCSSSRWSPIPAGRCCRLKTFAKSFPSSANPRAKPHLPHRPFPAALPPCGNSSIQFRGGVPARETLRACMRASRFHARAGAVKDAFGFPSLGKIPCEEKASRSWSCWW
jgi:hypothetical protein